MKNLRVLLLAFSLGLIPTLLWAAGWLPLAKPVPLWTPTNDPIWSFWWDASDTAHLTFNGSNISAWTDRIGGIVASQGTGANQPGWSATARNGKAGLTTDGSQYLQLASIAVLPGGTNALTLVGAAFSSGGSGFPWVFAYGDASLGAMRGIGGTNGANQPVSGSIFGAMTASALTWFTNDRLDVWTLPLGSSVTASLYVDGNDAVTSALSPAAVGTTGGFIGIRPGLTEGWVGTIQQIVIGNAVPSTSQRQCLESWESWWDGKAGANLPVGHPGKNGPPLIGGGC